MLKKKLPMAMFWTLIFVIWLTNEITWLMEGHQYAMPGLAFVALDGQQHSNHQQNLNFC